MDDTGEPQDNKPQKGRPSKGGAKSGDDSALIKPARPSLFGRLWSSFMAGVVVAAPVGITFALIYWFVTGPMARLDTFVKQTLPVGDSTIESVLQVLPGVGVFVAFVALVLLGALAKNFIGRTFISAGERFFESVPIVRTLYGFFKNVFETALQQSDRSFKEVALVQYPRRGAWAMSFVVGEAKGEVKHILDDTGERLTSIFVPTVPNPTSGFLLFVPRDDLRILNMSVEEAAKVVFSMGLVVPDYADADEAVKKLEMLAKQAREAPASRSLKSRLFKSK